MIHFAISVAWFLITLCAVVGIGYAVVWVLEQLGIPVPPMVVKIALLIIGLLCVIWFLTLLAGGGGMPFPALR